MSPLEKPLDTKKHASLRIDWVVERYGLLTNPLAPVCYIDEKWFYRVNRRRKIKHLPLVEGEENNITVAQKGKMISRRFPIKTMFMGVVARPIPHRRFGGKVLMERVSTTKRVKKATSHRNFTDDALVNEAICNGEWRELIGSTE